VILVFGSINVDLVVRVPRWPRPGETLPGDSFAALPGGKGANQALAARRAGATVALAGAVGNDAFATQALAGLAEANVDLTAVRAVTAPTGIALVQVDATGQNCITIVAGANAHADPDAIADTLLAPVTTLLLQLEVPLEATVDIVARARARGARIVLNAAPARALPASLLSAIDVLIVNEIEAASLAAALGMHAMPEALAPAMLRRFGCATVITLGAQGALAATSGRLLRLAAPPIQVVDTTGAGDAFVGALAAALDRGTQWPRALAEGVAAGSLACATAGAQPSLPPAAAIHRFAVKVESTLVSQSHDPEIGRA
jgi:ribokinase